MKGYPLSNLIQSKRYPAVYLYPMKNGDVTFYAGFNTPDGKWEKVRIGRKSHGITETYAYNKRIEFINMSNLGEDPIAHKKQKKQIIFDDVANEYFKNMEAKGNKSLYDPQNRYKNHVKKHIGNQTVGSIVRDDILTIKNTMEKTHSTATINHVITLVASIFNFAISSDIVRFKGKNPCEGLIQGGKLDNARDRFLSKSEVEQLLGAIKEDVEVDLMVRLSLSTGARLNSVMNIKAKDITAHKVNLYDFKNKKSYTGFLSDKLFSDTKFLEQLKPNDFVIGGKGEMYSTRKIQRRLKAVLDELFNQGLDVKDAKNRVVIHTLRHTFASLLVINGTPIYNVMRLMNHSSVDMTMRYAKLAPDSGQNAVNGLL